MAGPDSTDYQRGKLAYDTYREQVAGKSTVNGQFDDAAPWVHSAWIAVALAVAGDVLAERAPSGGIPKRGDLGL